MLSNHYFLMIFASLSFLFSIWRYKVNTQYLKEQEVGSWEYIQSFNNQKWYRNIMLFWIVMLPLMIGTFFFHWRITYFDIPRN